PQILKASLIPIPGTTDRYNVFAILSATRSANRVRFRVQVSASATDYYELGLLWAGDGLVFAAGLGIEWAWNAEDPSIVERNAGGGSISAYAYDSVDVLSITKKGLTNAVGMGAAGTLNSLRHMLSVAGRHSPII